MKKALTTKQAAELLVVSDQTIINWWKEGLLEAYKLDPNKSNSPLRISERSVEKLLKQRERLAKSTS